MNTIEMRVRMKKECRRLLVEVAQMHPETYQTRYAQYAPNLDKIIREAKSEYLLNDREEKLIWDTLKMSTCGNCEYMYPDEAGHADCACLSSNLLEMCWIQYTGAKNE